MKQSKPIDAFLSRFGGSVEASPSALAKSTVNSLTGDMAATTGATSELSALVQSLTQQTKAVSDNTSALGQATQSVDSIGASILSFAKQTLTGGGGLSGGGLLGISPLVSLIGGLFHRSNNATTLPDLPKFEMPDPLAWDLSVSPSSTARAETTTYGETGLPKTSTENRVTVNIQAMDARSFLDRSNEIASALRSAMLHSSSVNDVMAEME